MKRKPILALSFGEPAGIGPEVLVRSLSNARVRHACQPLVIGNRKVLEHNGWREGLAPLLDPGVECTFKFGQPTPSSGLASFAAFQLSVRLALKKLVDGIVTAPISKNAWQAAGISFLDHTSFLQHACGVRRIAMMLVDGNLRAVPVTRHIPLAQVSRRLDMQEIIDAARMAHSALREKLGIRRPELALCALNPHAGESGMLGLEERQILQPALRALKRLHVPIEGPVPADAAWAAHKAGRWDSLIALYHDQVMIPMKVADPYAVVNWTLGIPFARTSPGHGTAFDIAGKCAANPQAMIQAIVLAARLCR